MANNNDFVTVLGILRFVPLSLASLNLNSLAFRPNPLLWSRFRPLLLLPPPRCLLPTLSTPNHPPRSVLSLRIRPSFSPNILHSAISCTAFSIFCPHIPYYYFSSFLSSSQYYLTQHHFFFSPVFVLLLLPPLQIFWILQTTVIDFVWSLRLTTLLLTMSTKTSRLSFLPHPFRSFTPCYIGPKVVHYQPWLSSLANLQLTSFTPPLIYVAELFPSPRLTALSNDKNRSDCENDQLLGLLNYDAASAQHSTESVYMFKENINR